jgi:hypothetical protein
MFDRSEALKVYRNYSERKGGVLRRQQSFVNGGEKVGLSHMR